jgi:hypothetical protein
MVSPASGAQMPGTSKDFDNVAYVKPMLPH